jgi:micrococcal nuclease
LKISQKLFSHFALAIILNAALMVGSLSAQTITGKVVSIADGDTITVLHDRKQYKIRLYGIDCPESRQDFGARAKKFLSDMVFGKQVQVVHKDIDKYDRVVGMVYIGNTSVNQELVGAGLAWVYHQYCKENFCREWSDLEARAQASGIGLWSHPDPIPPWKYRRGAR